ncbi:MAG: 30S ribosomal protein S8 [Candidatus Portiera sp.]|nr:30S ribosomal protein S8 [Portiera sp.]
MTMQDPIADMLTRIRNALMAGATEVNMPHSKIKEEISKILVEEGYIKSYEASGEGATKEIDISLKYYRGEPVIEEIKKISKPGLRKYLKVDEIPYIKAGLGICILSTSKGMIVDRKARELKVGGELICTVF